MKQCSRCKLIKDLNDFYDNEHTSDGKQSRCKECTKTESKERYYTNREDILDKQSKRYYENREERLAYQLQYYRDNIEASKRYYERNRDKISDKYKTTKDYSIYVIKYDNEVLYVGSTTNSTSRMRDYNTKPYNTKQSSHTRPIARFIRKHIDKGTIENHFEIVESGVPEEYLRMLEQYYIDLYDTPLNARNSDGTLRDVRMVRVLNEKIIISNAE